MNANMTQQLQQLLQLVVMQHAHQAEGVPAQAQAQPQAHAQTQGQQQGRTQQTTQPQSAAGDVGGIAASVRNSSGASHQNQTDSSPDMMCMTGAVGGLVDWTTRSSYAAPRNAAAPAAAAVATQLGRSSRGSFAQQPQSPSMSRPQMVSLLDQQQQQHDAAVGGSSGQPPSGGAHFPKMSQPQGSVSGGGLGVGMSPPEGAPNSGLSVGGHGVGVGSNNESVSSGGARSTTLARFAGGWQSNADMPDRRRVIVNIVKIIERMRPDANKVGNRLPLMAKKLEEYLYRSALTKAEYVDRTTLKKRLQIIAHQLGPARNSPFSGSLSRETTKQQQQHAAAVGGSSGQSPSGGAHFPNMSQQQGRDSGGGLGVGMPPPESAPNSGLSVGGHGVGVGSNNESVSSEGARSATFADFAGGWQSNADLPDRRRVILEIVKIIKRMRPDANEVGNRLPLMAKKLEEYLYRLASTKAEYVDRTTLKKRLQIIAHQLDLTRLSSSLPLADVASTRPHPRFGRSLL